MCQSREREGIVWFGFLLDIDSTLLISTLSRNHMIDSKRPGAPVNLLSSRIAIVHHL